MGFPAIRLYVFFCFSIIVMCHVRENLTELRSQVSIIHASYPGGPMFQYQRENQVSDKAFLEFPNKDWDNIWDNYDRFFSRRP
jgi:hypothetical protein